jgi:plastocyanin
MRKVLVAASIVAAVTGGIASAAGSTKMLGTVGPGFTISLKSATGSKVGTLKAGKYTFVVSDKSAIHNFTVKGPGIANRTLTGTSFVGTKTAVLSLKPGTYTLYCTIHPTTVRTTITVK